jgi:methylenetetrahydrofolate dehydrogenase (NADP+)/methenyltetrahydrofolate cyclohydrolase
MSATIFDGKAFAAELAAELKTRVDSLIARGHTPTLAVVLVGQNPASLSYVRGKAKACARLGIRSVDRSLPASSTAGDLEAVVEELNRDSEVDGILVQLPLPEHIDSDPILQSINPEKDVDGFHPVNLGMLMRGTPRFLPCTPLGIVRILQSSGVDTEGKEVVVVGRSNIVGKPIAMMLMQKLEFGNATVTVCHTRTRDLAAHTRRADILIAAAGVPGAITADMVAEGAVVVDVGMNRVADATKKRGYRLVGDVDFEGVSEKASLITPVPGGVGRLTVAMLLENTVLACERRAGIRDNPW